MLSGKSQPHEVGGHAAEDIDLNFQYMTKPNEVLQS